MGGTTVGFAGITGVADGWVLSSAAFTAGEILSAFFTSTLTCQICGSVSFPLNPGMPVMRMPLSTFQYDSQASSSVTPLPLKRCGGAGAMPSAMLVLGWSGKPWHTAQFCLYTCAPGM